MKMRFIECCGTGGHTGKSWGTLGLLLLLLVSTQAVTAQKFGPAPLSAKGEESLRAPIENKLVAGAKVAKVAPAASLTGVTTSKESGNLVVSISASAPVPHKAFLYKDPSRLVVDFSNVESKVPFQNLAINTANIKQLRVGEFQRGERTVTRMVFDLEEGFGKYDVKTDGSSTRFLFPAGESGKQASATSKASVPEESRSLRPAPAPSRRNTTAKSAPAPARQLAAIAPSQPQITVAEIQRPAPPPATPTASNSSHRPLPVEVSKPASSQAAPTQETPAPAPAAQVPTAPSSRFTGAPLTLDLVDISLIDFFRLMAEEGGINIVMDPGIKGTLSMKVVKVPWDQIFDAALMNNGLDKQVEGNLVRIALRSTLQEEAKQREALKKANLLAADIETRIKRLNYAKASTLLPPLTEQKSVRGTVVFDERTNSLILTDLPSSIQKMLELVEVLDIPQPQVEIEARIVSATRDFARDIGVQFGFVQGNLERVTVGGPNTFGTIGGTRPSATPTTTFAAGNTRTGRGAAEGTATQSSGVSTGLGTGKDAGNLNVNMPSQKPFGGIGISVGNIFDTFLLDAAITAGENKGLAKLISQPKTVTTNNSPATITQGLRFPVQIIANNTITVQFQNAALTLVATPQITYEGNIVLDLQIENNTPDFSRAVNGIPSIRTSESKTRVLVTNGGTTVIGGILIDNEETAENRIPGLASLPFVGNIFKRQTVSHNTQEVLFFITPKIIK